MGAIIRSRLLSALVAFGGLMLAWSVTAEQAVGYPLVLVPQGVSVLTLGTELVDGEEVPRRVFVIRDGSIVTVLATVAPGTGSALVFCPRERFFVSPEDGSLFDRAGRYVDGPATGDMAEYRRQIDPEALDLFVGSRVERPRSAGQVSGEAGEAYRNWRADPEVPQKFCQDPVR